MNKHPQNEKSTDLNDSKCSPLKNVTYSTTLPRTHIGVYGVARASYYVGYVYSSYYYLSVKVVVLVYTCNKIQDTICEFIRHNIRYL
jgi:hypothetical protein